MDTGTWVVKLTSESFKYHVQPGHDCVKLLAERRTRMAVRSFSVWTLMSSVTVMTAVAIEQ